MVPRILTLYDSGMTVTVTLTNLSSDRDLSLCGVPSRIATDLFGLRAMPFYTEPNMEGVYAALKSTNTLAVVSW